MSKALGGSLASLAGEKEGGHRLDLSIYPTSARLAAILVKLGEVCFGYC